jgi:16S rRNA (cytidine1402-2'-O)-methyltransferase
MSHHRASLYVVATPIGNLDDITLRALAVLRDVDAVVSENIRKTRYLLRHHGIATRVLSYREENAVRMGEVVLELVAGGKSVALVAEAGTPGVSDPGRRLVDEALKRGLKVVPVPGPSAAVAAVSVSGMEEPRFVFEGFLPRRGSKRRQRLRELARDPRPIVLFEAPHRVLECLEDIRAVLGERTCVVARELTKVHEEVAKASVSAVIARFTAARPLGEFVIVCEGSGAPGGEGEGAGLEAAVAEAMDLVRSGLKARAAAKVIAKRHGLKTSAIYDGVRLAKPGNRTGDRR